MSAPTMPRRSTSQLTPLQVVGDQQHYRARVLLEDRRLLVRADNPGGAIGPLGLAYGFTNLHGALWVRAEDVEKARRIIEGAGIYVAGAQRPIVDRSEPHCPTCGGDLEANDKDDDDVCPTCGLEFHWVNIEEPEVNPDGLYCEECSYDLTGNTMGRCPECNAPILARADVIVDQVTRAVEDHHPAETVDSTPEFRPIGEILSWKRIAILSLIATVIGAVLFHETEAGAGDPFLSLKVGLACGLGLLTALLLLRTAGALAGSRHAGDEQSD